MLSLLIKYYPAFLKGAMVTLSMAAAAWLTGIIVGAIVGYSASKAKIGSIALGWLSTLIGALPVIAILFWFHYPFQVIIGAVVDPYWTTIFVLSLLNVLMVADIIHHAAVNFPQEFKDCAALYGVSRRTAIQNIELPLVARASIPSILRAQVAILHMTLFASLISVDELFRTAQRINAIESRVVDIYSLLAIFYLLISLPLILLANGLKKKFSFDLSER